MTIANPTRTPTLPVFLRQRPARHVAASYLAALTPFEVQVLDTAASGGWVYACKPGVPSNGLVVLTQKGQPADRGKTYNGAQTTVDRLVHRGWLRFAESPASTQSGLFWLTFSAENVWRVLGRIS
jgi:hypothetical protein